MRSRNDADVDAAGRKARPVELTVGEAAQKTGTLIRFSPDPEI